MRCSLTCHPDTPARHVTAVEVEVAMPGPDHLRLTFSVAPAVHVAVPEPAAPMRTDELWQRTCFELFVAGDAGRYLEFNFSPSSQWAAYAFDGYRSGMHPFSVVSDPHVETTCDAAMLTVEAGVDLAGMPPGVLTIGLSAVVEEADGTKSYWALRHPPGKPDFHHRESMCLQLPGSAA